MFVVSLNSDKLKKILISCFAVVFAIIGGVVYVSLTEVAPVSKIGGYSMKASTAEERTAFFSQFGWEINKDPAEVKEVIIPEEFDETYTEYNKLQISQGLDLEPFKGVRVKYWSYEILNYPQSANNRARVMGNILIYDGIVVGGDICSTELDGFMHGFSMP